MSIVAKRSPVSATAELLFFWRLVFDLRIQIPEMTILMALRHLRVRLIRSEPRSLFSLFNGNSICQRASVFCVVHVGRADKQTMARPRRRDADSSTKDQCFI